MPDYYLHPILGNNSNPGTISSPKQFYDFSLRSLLVAGDRVFFHRAYDNPIVSAPLAFLSPRAGTPNNPVYYGAWGEAQKRYATVFKLDGVDSMIFNGSGNQGRHTIWEDIEFDCRNQVNNAIYLGSQGADQVFDLVFRRCGFIRSNGSGLNIVCETTATALPPTNIISEDCWFWDNVVHGVFLQGSNNRIIRFDTRRNGKTAVHGGHGISLGAPKVDLAASGWTQVGVTNVYSRTVPSNHANLVFAIRFPGRPRITQYTGPTPESLTGTNQFAIAGTTLYINLGGINPNTLTSAYAWRRCSGNVIAEGIAEGNYWNREALYREGHGIAADDWSESNLFIGNRSINNEGTGYSNNLGHANVWCGNLAEGNWSGALAINPSDNLRIINNTFLENNVRESTMLAEIQINTGSSNSVISNNLIVTTRAFGIYTESADIGLGGTNNVIFGATNTPTRFGTFTNTQVFNPDPFLNADRSLKIPPATTEANISAANPLALAGTYIQGVTLINGRMRPGWCPIGAYQAILPKTQKN